MKKYKKQSKQISYLLFRYDNRLNVIIKELKETNIKKFTYTTDDGDIVDITIK